MTGPLVAVPSRVIIDEPGSVFNGCSGTVQRISILGTPLVEVDGFEEFGFVPFRSDSLVPA